MTQASPKKLMSRLRGALRSRWKQIAYAGRWKNRRVDFAICGAQKGGTTALDSYLRDHADICMADYKEVHFFDDERQFTRRPSMARYHACFTPQPSHKIIGEATPIYMYWADAPRRIWEYNPGMKIIVVLRNPIDRAFSHWNMEHQRGNDDATFSEAIRNETDRCRKALPFQHRVYSYVDRGFYMSQLRRLWQFFPRDQVLVIKSDDLRQAHGETLTRVTDFLGVELSDFESKTVHARAYQAPMEEEDRRYLAGVFEHEIAELERTFQWDCRDWLNV